ncbi:hypothetical protein, partial [Mesorhizobium sp. M7A.F.Ca.US.006.01.1.1]|uniref:hypothetical protein n=1 Tax=Mesorhizobium sp. M7A.F.Ca.US.006.01.1.1 TaxID=2496707 RepID=UPI0019D2CC1D
GMRCATPNGLSKAELAFCVPLDGIDARFGGPAFAKSVLSIDVQFPEGWSQSGAPRLTGSFGVLGRIDANPKRLCDPTVLIRRRDRRHSIVSV